MEPYKVADETFVIPNALPVPGVGQLPVNAMVIRGAQPMLLDTLAIVHREAYLEQRVLARRARGCALAVHQPRGS